MKTKYRLLKPQYRYVGTLITLSVGIVFLVCSLISYDPYDPSWFYTSSLNHELHNFCGVFGSHVAAFLIFLWGCAAFLWIPFLCLCMYLLWIKRSLAHEWDRLMAGVTAISLISVLARYFHIEFSRHTVAGGYMGWLLLTRLQRSMDDYVIILMVMISIGICCIIISRVSFIAVAMNIMRGIRYILNKKRCVAFLRATAIMIQKIIGYCYRGYYALKQLLDGSLVEQSGESIITFEGIVHNELAQGYDSHDTWLSTLKSHEYSSPLGSEPSETMKMTSTTQHKNSEPRIHSTDEDDESEKTVSYRMPSREIFVRHEEPSELKSHQEREKAKILEEKLERFGIGGRVVSIKVGPLITLFEYQPAIDIKISKIIALEDDLALALQATSIRILAPIPGKSVVGFEVANTHRTTVYFSNLMHSIDLADSAASLPLVLGVDTIGKVVMVDLAGMPHLLIAGSTGSGKSVALNTMLVSLLSSCTPETLKLILIDPKRLEFAPYADIPHLIFPIVTDVKLASSVLKWVVKTMDERYKYMAEVGVRNIFDYHKMAAHRNDMKSLPFIVVMIDELADLMMLVGREIEELIARITQMARAAGIHMILATQRPSVDIITGVIKANFPSRIACRVASKIDSRTILDCGGADKLLGKGDMLFKDSASHIQRIHGAYITDEEIERLTAFIRSQQNVVYYDLEEPLSDEQYVLSDADEHLYKQVLDFISSIDEVSISLLQRRFRIGYNRSARIIDMLEAQGRILSADGSKTRKVIR